MNAPCNMLTRKPYARNPHVRFEEGEGFISDPLYSTSKKFEFRATFFYFSLPTQNSGESSILSLSRQQSHLNVLAVEFARMLLASDINLTSSRSKNSRNNGNDGEVTHPNPNGD